MKKLALLPLFAATPAVAHPTALAHGHGADWMVPAGLALIALAGMAARRARVKARK